MSGCGIFHEFDDGTILFDENDPERLRGMEGPEQDFGALDLLLKAFDPERNVRQVSNGTLNGTVRFEAEKFYPMRVLLRIRHPHFRRFHVHLPRLFLRCRHSYMIEGSHFLEKDTLRARINAKRCACQAVGADP